MNKMEFHHFLIHLLLRLHIIFLLNASATPLTFEFSPFMQSDTTIKLRAEGNASVGSDQSLHLTNDADQSQTAESIGRVSYSEPFLLWQRTTGKLADFTTHFTFVINPPDNGGYGLVFFLAPNGSLLNTELGRGDSMGLPVNSTLESRNEYAFVAVEFHTFRNQEPTFQDRQDDHVGIDVNSLHSIATQHWQKDGFPSTMMASQQNKAMISYDSNSKNLTVSLITSSVMKGPFPETTVEETSLQPVRVDLNKYLPDRVIVGFSAASNGRASYSIMSWNFTSTQLVDPPLPPPPSTAQVPVSPKKAPESLTTSGQESQIPSPSLTSIAMSRKKNIPVLTVAVIICSTVGVVFLFGGFIWFIFWIKNRPPGSNIEELPMTQDPADVQFGKETGPQQFSHKELEVATGYFSEGIGHGGFGDVYRGFLNSLNCYVAVKKISKDSHQGPREYGAEIRILSSLRHRNLVQLLGWCHEKEALLVYEFMVNGSLDSHLFKGQSLLSWEKRYRIAQGLAAVLKYIQDDCNQYVVHRDIKSSNVMLDSEFNPKLGDFGLARFVDHDKTSKTTIVAGTVGYMDPEYIARNKASKDSDIYSFGVVALEIACGRKPFDPRLGDDKSNMVNWVWELYRGRKVIEAADPKLVSNYNRSQMECLLIVGLWCSHPDRKIRPKMDQVIDVLNFKDVPTFPVIPPPVDQGYSLFELEEHSIYLTSSEDPIDSI